MLLEITEKVLLDCNIMYSLIVHRIHGCRYCLLFLLLFTVYTITVYWYLYYYCHCIVAVF